METKSSTARTVLNVGWWLNNVVIAILLIAMQSMYSSLGSDGGGDVLLVLTIIVLFFAVIVQIILKKGLNNIPNSKGWAVAYLILGILGVNILNIIGGALGLSENSKQQDRELIMALKSQNETAETDLREDSIAVKIEQLYKLKEEGILSEEEFKNAKSKLLN